MPGRGIVIVVLNVINEDYLRLVLVGMKDLFMPTHLHH